MLAELSFVVSVAGAIPYVYSILKREIQPERATWGIWTLVLVLAVAAYGTAGAGKSIYFLVGDLCITAVIFGISLRYGVGGWSKLDRVCLLAAVFGLLLWQLSHTPFWQIAGAVVADMVAVVPTIRKSLQDPLGDSPITFAASALAALLGVLSVGRWDVVLILYPLYLYSINFLTAVVIGTSRYFAKHTQVNNKKGNYANYKI